MYTLDRPTLRWIDKWSTRHYQTDISKYIYSIFPGIVEGRGKEEEEEKEEDDG